MAREILLPVGLPVPLQRKRVSERLWTRVAQELLSTVRVRDGDMLFEVVDANEASATSFTHVLGRPVHSEVFIVVLQNIGFVSAPLLWAVVLSGTLFRAVNAVLVSMDILVSGEETATQVALVANLSVGSEHFLVNHLLD